MVSQEVQRILLLIAMAATAYVLILEWNDDYGPGTSAPVTLPERPSVTDADAPVLPEIATDGQSDVPDPSVLQPAPTREAPKATPAPEQATDRLVEVVTDTLDVWIDRRGGDIVRVRLREFGLTNEAPEVPFPLLERGNGHVYVAQSGLIGPDGIDAGGERPLYEAAAKSYRLHGTESVEVRLSTRAGDTEINKVFVFRGDGYLVDVRYEIDNGGAEPLEMALFAQLKRDGSEPFGANGAPFAMQPYLGAALTTDETRYEKLEFEELEEERFELAVEGGWIAILQHYFLSVWVANEGVTNQYYGYARDDGMYIVGYTTPVHEIAAGETGVLTTRLYAGPKHQKRLGEIAENLNLTVDYGFLWWLAVPLFYLLDWLHSILGNWGLSIIALTLVVKLVLYPLSAASYKSMANMRRMSPQLKRLQERHAGDRQKLSQEMMNLYRKERINPLGGCLPIVIQMPVFISLYWVLFESVQLRQAPFFLWIDDLSSMDPYFVLPILMGATMYFQQTLNPPMPDPMQARVMKFMPIMFTVLFLFFPAGLVLYWLVNNVLSMAQQWYITRQIEGAAKA